MTTRPVPLTRNVSSKPGTKKLRQRRRRAEPGFINLVMHWGDGKDLSISATQTDPDSIPDIGLSSRTIEGTLVLPDLVGAADIPDLEITTDDDVEFEFDEDA